MLKQFFNQLRPTSLLQGAVLFKPSDISNLVLWLAPNSAQDSSGNLPDDAEDVATWVDLSGQGNNCIGVPTRNPSYETSGVNGIGSVEFDETNSERFTQTGVTPKNNMTIFVVFKRFDSVDTTLKVFVGSQEGDYRCRIGTSGRKLACAYGTTSLIQIAAQGIADNTSWFGSVRWNDTADDHKMKLTRVLDADEWTNVTTHNGQDIDSLNDEPFHIGDSNIDGTSAGSDWDGLISEILVYEKYLSDAEMSLVEGYLYDKYTSIPEPDPGVPGTISNLALWLAPDSCRDSGGNLPDDGEDVATWLDKSGNENNCSATGTPTAYETSGIGGLGSVRFDENAQEWFTQTGVTPKNNMTIFVVFNRESSGDYGGKVFVGAETTGKRCRIGTHGQSGVNDQQVTVGYGTDAIRKVNYNLSANTDYWSYVRWNNTADDVKQKLSTGNTYNWTHDGTDIDADNNYPFFIGTNNFEGVGQTATDWDGLIAEVIIYEKYLSDTEVATIEAYLNYKYSI